MPRRSQLGRRERQARGPGASAQRDDRLVLDQEQ